MSTAPGAPDPPAPSAGGAPRAVAPGLLLFATLALFLVWSNTFLAMETLLAPRSGRAPMSWIDLSVARFLPVLPIAALWCFVLHRKEALEIVRQRPGRLLLCGLLAVPGYSALVYLPMAHRVSGPVASLVTTLSPLYLVVLGALTLHERIGRRQVAGLVLGLGGVVLVASAKPEGGAHPAFVAVLALAPLTWSVYSVLTRTVAGSVSPLVWTYLVLVAGSLPLLPLVPWYGGPALLELDGPGWAGLLYLSLGGTVFGNAVWSWLLRHLPASRTGFTIFLNPPLTLASKRVLAALFPAAFTFDVAPREWLGGALALGGVALAVLPRRSA